MQQLKVVFHIWMKWKNRVDAPFQTESIKQPTEPNQEYQYVWFGKKSASARVWHKGEPNNNHKSNAIVSRNQDGSWKKGNKSHT